MKKILSNEYNFNDIMKNVPDFLMAGGGFCQDVSSILTGRPSKTFNIKNTNEKDLEKIFDKLYNNYKNNLNFLTLSIKGHALAVEGTLEINGERFLKIRNPWGSGNKEDIDSTDSDKKLKGTAYSEFNSKYTNTGYALLNAKDIKKTFVDGSVLDLR